VKRLLVLSAAIFAVAVPAAGAPAPNRVQVVGKEFTLTLSRGTLPPGPAIIQFVNFGQDPHNLKVQRLAAGSHIRGIGIVAPGGHGDLAMRLRAGRYRLWCSLANHASLGMQAFLTVK
jgi:hypothetical protein